VTTAATCLVGPMPETFAISSFPAPATTSTTPSRRPVTLDQLVSLLTTHERRRDKDGRAWSGATYRPGSTRANANVIEWSVAAGDFDHLSMDEYMELRESLVAAGVAFVLYSTYGSNDVDFRFRIAIPLTKPVPRAQYTDVWHRINAHLFGGRNDPQTKDASRMLYTPAAPEGVATVAEYVPGLALDWEKLPEAPARRSPVPNAPARSGQTVAVSREVLMFTVDGAPSGSQRGMAVRAARALLGAGKSVEDAIELVWRGLRASPLGDAARPWTEDHARKIVESIAGSDPPPLERWSALETAAPQPANGHAADFKGTDDQLRALVESAVPIGEPTVEADGAAILEDLYAFLGRFVAYPSAHAHVAHVLWIAHTHLMVAWESTPRLAALSPEPGSGKTRLLEVTELLVPRPVEAVNVTPAYLFRKVGDPGGAPTILFDEIDTVFGPKAREHEEIRGLLNAGHRRGAVAGRCVVKGKRVETEEIPAYCAVAIAGLGALPDTILTRSIVLKMRRRAPGEVVEPFRRRVHATEGQAIRDRLAVWARSVEDAATTSWPTMPDGIVDRDADLWEPLLAVADAAGGDWPDRARCSAVAHVADSKGNTPSLGVRLLTDLWAVFQDAGREGHEALSTSSILKILEDREDSPWSELRAGKPINARWLSQRLRQYGITSKNVRIGETVAKGYVAADLSDAWDRYVPVPLRESATSATDEASPPGGAVADRVADDEVVAATSATDDELPWPAASVDDRDPVPEWAR